jgi:hypothetical protein
MRIVIRAMLVGCVIAGCALSVLGQIGIGSGAAARLASQPYRAKFNITTEQTLANGTTITRETTEFQAEDSQGRHRSENITPAYGEMAGWTIFHINDPKARTDVMWTTYGKTVSVRKRPPVAQSGQQRTCWSYSGEGQEVATTIPARQIAEAAPEVAVAALQARSQEHSRSAAEELGMRTIQGVEVSGIRFTETTPAGAVGNDAPLVRTIETWRATSLPLIVRSVTDDPRSGKRTRELVELTQSEPDPALFELPEGYRVVTSEPHEVACSQ